MVRPRSIQPLTSPAISASLSGVSTTKGYSTRQSVASVTWLTRDKPSNLMLSFAVRRLSTRCVVRRSVATSTKAASNASTALSAATSNSPTMASRSGSLSGVRLFCTSESRCCRASTNSTRRFGLSSKSSCKYGLRCTTQMSPSTSYSMRAERPVRRSSRNWLSKSQDALPSRRMTISRSENEV